MSFTWPLSLLALAVVPVVLGVYLLGAAPAPPRAVTYSSLALLRRAVPRRSRWLRHVPVGLLLASLAVLAHCGGAAQLTADVPTNEDLDHPRAGRVGLDVLHRPAPRTGWPSRSEAALQYVADQPGGTKIGLVLFNGFAELAVPPTTNRAALDQALDNLTTGPGTAIGAAILQSLNAIAADRPEGRSRSARQQRSARAAPSQPVERAGNPPRRRSRPERRTPKTAMSPTSSSC